MMLPLRKLGSTDLLVSALGLGTVKFGRNTDVKYPAGFTLPTDKEIVELLALAKAHNFNLIDTAPAYGNSEERLGKALKNQRHDWVIVGKAGEEYNNQTSSYDFSKDAVMKSIQRSLQRLKTDYIDVLLIHSDGNDEHIIKHDEVFNTLEQAKKEGLIRYYGMSTKTVAGGLLTVQHADVAMVTCNPTYADEIEVITEAERAKKGILIKKAFASGNIDKIGGADPVQNAMNYIFNNAGVSSVIIGTINTKHLVDNVRCAVQTLCK